MSRDRTCEERIAQHMASRLADFRAMAELAAYSSGEELTREARDLLDERGMKGIDPAKAESDVNEAGDEAMAEYPLSVSSFTTFRVDLSTGGPGDWLEVRCSGDTPLYEPEGAGGHYAIEVIIYHFVDWFDHAERTLEGDDLAAAEAFVLRVVPELIG